MIRIQTQRSQSKPPDGVRATLKRNKKTPAPQGSCGPASGPEESVIRIAV